VDYEDRTEVRKPVSRNRGRTNSRSRSGASIRISPNKPSNERIRPSLDSNAGIRGRPSQTNARPFIPQFTTEAEDTFVFQQPARDQVQPSLAFEQFQPRIEQSRAQQAAPSQTQQFIQPQAQQTRQPQAQQFRQPQAQQTRQPQSQQIVQPRAQQFIQPQAQQFRQPQAQQVRQPPANGLASQQTQQFPPHQQQRSLQSSPRRPAPAQRQQQPLPAQAAPVFNQADSLFSNIIVSPQDGEQGGGVYFSYTAVLGN
jgi:hypothetical protein